VSENKTVFFVCDKFPELTITIKPEDWKEIDGKAIKVRPVRVNFEKKPFRGNWRGEFKTKDPEMVATLESLDVFASGVIRIDQDPDAKDRVAPERVKQGETDSGKKEASVATPAPQDAASPAPKVKKPAPLSKKKQAVAGA
jgi:hypothetical protein